MNNTHDIPLKQIIESALSKIGEVVDVNTVIGEPITAGEVTIIPFSKVSVGFASGGSEFGGKNATAESKPYFAGGNGAGVSMTPLGFIVVEKSGTRVIEIGNPTTYAPATDPVNRALDGINGVIDKTPDIISRISDLIASYRTKSDEPVDEDVTAVEINADDIVTE